VEGLAAVCEVIRSNLDFELVGQPREEFARSIHYSMGGARRQAPRGTVEQKNQI
jgi:hypothetical protein